MFLTKQQEINKNIVLVNKNMTSWLKKSYQWYGNSYFMSEIWINDDQFACCIKLIITLSSITPISFVILLGLSSKK